MKTNITIEIKTILKPVLFFIVLIILSIIVAKEGFARISSLRNQLDAEKQKEAILAQKESLLREVAADTSVNTEVSLAAVPAKNPALIALSQFKTLSSDKSVLLSNIKVGMEAKETDLSSIEIRLDVEGNLSSVLDFMKTINTLLPITLVEKVKLSSQGEISRASVIVKVFFSSYPTQLTSLTEPLEGLTTEEKAVLAKLAQSVMPSFVEVQPLPVGLRANPFE